MSSPVMPQFCAPVFTCRYACIGFWLPWRRCGSPAQDSVSCFPAIGHPALGHVLQSGAQAQAALGAGSGPSRVFTFRCPGSRSFVSSADSSPAPGDTAPPPGRAQLSTGTTPLPSSGHQTVPALEFPGGATRSQRTRDHDGGDRPASRAATEQGGHGKSATRPLPPPPRQGPAHDVSPPPGSTTSQLPVRGRGSGRPPCLPRSPCSGRGGAGGAAPPPRARPSRFAQRPAPALGCARGARAHLGQVASGLPVIATTSSLPRWEGEGDARGRRPGSLSRRLALLMSCGGRGHRL